MTMKPSLTKSLIGFETECIIINESGIPSPGADSIIKQADPTHVSFLKKECSQEMIEVISLPFLRVSESLGHLLDQLEYTVGLAATENSLLLPLFSKLSSSVAATR